MPLLPDNLLELAQRYVWLLRDDLRKTGTMPSPKSEAFKSWWLMKGRSEYPAWSQLSEDEIKFLSAPTTEVTIANVTFMMPRAYSLVLQYRPDVIKRFTVNGKLDQIGTVAWFLGYGIHEMHLTEVIPQSLIAALDTTMPTKDNSLDTPQPTLLMWLVFYLLDPRIRKALPLDQPKTREKFIMWLVAGAMSNLKIGPIVASRWKQWLRQWVVLEGTSIELPRFVKIHLLTQEDFAKQYDISKPSDIDRLITWSEKAIKPNGDWYWLGSVKKHTPINQEEDLNRRPFGVNLYGFAFGELGIGEDLRMAVECCESAKIPYRVVNIDPGTELRQMDEALKKQVSESDEVAPYAINIFCMPGFDTVARVFLGLGEEVFKGHYNIGWWPWELSVWPQKWKDAFVLMDEIWGGSNFSRQMYALSTDRPTHYMPLPVSVSRGRTRSRDFFGLPEKAFLFLFMFDFNSHLHRKNPFAVIEAFQLAFPKRNQSTHLVLKVMNVKGDNPEWQKLEGMLAEDARIHVISQTLDREDVLGLVECCDGYISLHRAEGFGRTLAEAMMYGKPVVATYYSGNADFMDDDLTFRVAYEQVPIETGQYPFVDKIDRAVWAQPDVADAAEKMKLAKLAANKKGYKERVLSFASQQFSIARTGQMMLRRLRQIAQ